MPPQLPEALLKEAGAIAKWHEFIKTAENKRLDHEKFERYAKDLGKGKYKISADILASLLLQPRNAKDIPGPSTNLYFRALLKHQLIDITAVLKALYNHSSLHTNLQAGDAVGDADAAQQTPKKPIRWYSSSSLEDYIFMYFSRHPAEVNRMRNPVSMAKLVITWLKLYNDVAAALSRDTYRTVYGVRSEKDLEESRNGFAILLGHVVQNANFSSRIGHVQNKLIREKLAVNLETFIANMSQGQMAYVLEPLIQFSRVTLPSFNMDAPAMNNYVFGALPDPATLPDPGIVNSRAGLYIYLNAALVARPLIDDTSLLTYLHHRYQGDFRAAAVQLILASFDVLANAVFRNEGAKQGHLLKSYVANKVPLILGNIAALASSASMYPFDAQFCITQALNQVDTNVFPTLSGMFDMHSASSSFQDSVRQDFCFACQLHGLITQQASEALLGDITYQSLPAGGRYMKDTLVQSCLEDTEKTLKLIGELDNTDGNVGAAAQAIIEIIGTLCRNKETMTLKQLCSQLASKPQSLDVLLLFEKPHRILHPLCELLDNWTGYDDDQAEYQPVYEEFGSILLLLLAFLFRYDISPRHLGITSPNSFIWKIKTRDHVGQHTEPGSHEHGQIDRWLDALFVSKNGLGDDLLSSCPPQEFYMLMPNLLHAIVIGFSKLDSLDSLKDGLEYLFDVLLLPALVPACLYLSTQLQMSTDEAFQRQSAVIIRILQFVLQPKSISTEASAMLSSVLYIVAVPLERSLRKYQRHNPNSQEIEPLLAALKEHLPLSRRTMSVDHKELESWTTTTRPATNNLAVGASTLSTGGIYAAIRLTVQNLVQWAENMDNVAVGASQPASYSNKQILVACQMLTPKRALGALLEELRAQETSGHGPVAYDVVTAIVCAPDVTTAAGLSPSNVMGGANHLGAAPSQQQQQNQKTTLQKALKAEVDGWKELHKKDPGAAETILRLDRRVEAQMALPPPELVMQSTSVELGALGVGGDDLNNAIVAAAAAQVVGDPMTIDTTGLDTNMSLDPLSGLASATGSVGGGGSGGLDLGDDFFGQDYGGGSFNWGDTMDLT